MTFINFEDGYIPQEAPEVQYLCWRATEILGAYMLEGFEVERDESLDARISAQIASNEGQGSKIEPDDFFYDEDEPEGPILCETHRIEINSLQLLHLSNRPFLADQYGKRIAYSRPGYVAILVEPYLDNPDDMDPEVRDAQCDQIIFRLPHASSPDGAAIFHGYSLDEKDRIDGKPAELRALKTLLKYLSQCLMEIMLSEDGAWEDTYHSQRPEPTIDLEFRKMLDEES